jgi:hypothetical protein
MPTTSIRPTRPPRPSARYTPSSTKSISSQNFKREEVHGLLTLDKHPNTLVPGDYPVAWCKAVGQAARSSTPSLGHREDVWTSEAYQKHILGGLRLVARTRGRQQHPAGQLQRAVREGEGRGLQAPVRRQVPGRLDLSASGRQQVVERAARHPLQCARSERARHRHLHHHQVPRLHRPLRIPGAPGSNSGFYLRGRYEIQIFDNANKDGHRQGPERRHLQRRVLRASPPAARPASGSRSRPG